MKAKLIPVILIFVLLLSGCTADTSPQNTTGKDDGIKYPKADVNGTNVIYISTDAGCVPVSICKNGTSLLTDENYYYNIQNTIDNDLTLKDKTYTLFTNSGKNLGQVSLDDIKQNKISSSPLCSLVTSGNWKLCPNLKRTVYDDKQKADSGYYEFINKSFPDVKNIKICEIFEYDIDGDNDGEAIVVAKANDFTGVALLSQSMGNSVLCSSTANSKDFCAHPFVADIDGNGKYSLLTITGSGLKTATFYKENSTDIDYKVYLPLGA